MAAEWKEAKIGELVNIRRGASPRPIKDYLVSFGMPWVKIADATRDKSRFIFKTEEFIKNEGIHKSVKVEPGTLIVSNSATPGLPKIMAMTACVHDGWLIFSNFNNVRKEFLYYKFIEIRKMLSNQANGSVFQNLKTDIVREFKITIPDIVTQDKIIKILSSLDEKIELNNKINENLLAQAQAIFKSWFVDFESFDGKKPNDWKEVLLEDICTIQNGYAFKSSDYCENGCKMVRVTNINDCYLDNENYIELPSNFYDDEKYRQFQLKKFDCLLVMVGASVGKIGIVTEKDLPCLQNQNMWRFRGKNINISQPFIYFAIHAINKYVCGWSTGSARDFYRKDIFAKAKCILPPSHVLEKFNQIQLNIFEKISNNLLENKQLAQIRDTLLTKLMSGELEV